MLTYLADDAMTKSCAMSTDNTIERSVNLWLSALGVAYSGKCEPVPLVAPCLSVPSLG